MDKLRIIVGGYIGLYPSGGVTWDYIQYPLGLQLLGHDVYYIEDTLQYPAYASHYNSWDDAYASVEHLSTFMKYFGLENRWAYRDVASGKTYGIPEEKVTHEVLLKDKKLYSELYSYQNKDSDV